LINRLLAVSLNISERGLPLLEDPRSLGESLKGRFREYWNYRVGDYRIVVDIQDDVLRVLVVQIGNRKEVYR